MKSICREVGQVSGMNSENKKQQNKKGACLRAHINQNVNARKTSDVDATDVVNLRNLWFKT